MEKKPRNEIRKTDGRNRVAKKIRKPICCNNITPNVKYSHTRTICCMQMKLIRRGSFLLLLMVVSCEYLLFAPNTLYHHSIVALNNYTQTQLRKHTKSDERSGMHTTIKQINTFTNQQCAHMS